LPSPRPRLSLSVRQAVAHNLKQLREARGWSQEALEARVSEAGGTVSRSKISRLEQEESKVLRSGEMNRTGELRVQEMLDLARALGVAPLAMLSPPAGAELRLGESKTSPKITGRRFREWLVGRRPLNGQDAEWFFAHLPDPIEQTSEWHDLQALAGEAVWAAQDPDVTYGEAMDGIAEFQSRFELLIEQLALTAKRQDPAGAAVWQRRRQWGNTKRTEE
jgi:transcriptional regulator with XRE-family HTH domain